MTPKFWPVLRLKVEELGLVSDRGPCVVDQRRWPDTQSMNKRVFFANFLVIWIIISPTLEVQLVPKPQKYVK